MNAPLTPLPKKQRIAQLLASGIKAEDVKLIVGVSEGYMTRLKEDQEFKHLLTAYAVPDSEEAQQLPEAGLTSQATEADRLADRYAVLESRVVNNLIDKVALADTNELTRLLAAIQKSRPTQAPAPTVVANGNVQINLTLPHHALGRDAIQLSSDNQVVAVQGQNLTALDMEATSSLIEQARKKRHTAIRNPEPHLVEESLRGEYHDL